MYSQDLRDAPNIPPYTGTESTMSSVDAYPYYCGMDFGKMEAEERRFEEMRREERREQAIAWLREQRAIYIDTRRCPNLIKGFSTYKRTRARRRVR